MNTTLFNDTKKQIKSTIDSLEANEELNIEETENFVDCIHEMIDTKDPKLNRIQLAPDLYDLFCRASTSDFLPLLTVSRIGSAFVRLARHPKKCGDGDDDLVLPSGPIYKALQTLLFPSTFKNRTGPGFVGAAVKAHLEPTAISVATVARKYFDFAPTIHSLHSESQRLLDISCGSGKVDDSFYEAVSLLTLLVPARTMKRSLDAQTQLDLRNMTRNMLSIWKCIPSNVSGIDEVFMAMFARLSKHAYLNSNVDLSSDLRDDWIIDKTFASLDAFAPHGSLPLMNQTMIPGFAVIASMCGGFAFFHNSAKWLGYSFSSSSSSSLSLSGFLGPLANLMHPSNSGVWSVPCATMVSTLASISSIIVKRDQHQDQIQSVQSEWRSIQINGLFPILKMALMGKIPRVIDLAQRGIANICATTCACHGTDCNIDIDFLMQLIRLACDALTAVNEHQAVNVLGLLSRISRELVESLVLRPVSHSDSHSELPIMVFELLSLSLAGIDPTDNAKTESTLKFWTSFFMWHGDISCNSKSNMKVLDFVMEDWIPRAMDRLIALVESKEATTGPTSFDQNTTTAAATESPNKRGMSDLLKLSIESILTCCPPDILFSLSHRWGSQLFSVVKNLGYDNSKEISTVFGAISRSMAAQPKQQVQFLEPVLTYVHEIVRDYPTSLANSDTNSEMLVVAASLRCLSEAIEYQPHLVLDLNLVDLIMFFVQVESKNVSVYEAQRLVKKVLRSLSGTFLHESEWHVPSSQQLELADTIVDEIVKTGKYSWLNACIKGIGEYLNMETNRQLARKIASELHREATDVRRMNIVVDDVDMEVDSHPTSKTISIDENVSLIQCISGVIDGGSTQKQVNSLKRQNRMLKSIFKNGFYAWKYLPISARRMKLLVTHKNSCLASVGRLVPVQSERLPRQMTLDLLMDILCFACDRFDSIAHVAMKVLVSALKKNVEMSLQQQFGKIVIGTLRKAANVTSSSQSQTTILNAVSELLFVSQSIPLTTSIMTNWNSITQLLKASFMLLTAAPSGADPDSDRADVGDIDGGGEVELAKRRLFGLIVFLLNRIDAGPRGDIDGLMKWIGEITLESKSISISSSSDQAPIVGWRKNLLIMCLDRICASNSPSPSTSPSLKKRLVDGITNDSNAISSLALTGLREWESESESEPMDIDWSDVIRMQVLSRSDSDSHSRSQSHGSLVSNISGMIQKMIGGGGGGGGMAQIGQLLSSMGGNKLGMMMASFMDIGLFGDKRNNRSALEKYGLSGHIDALVAALLSSEEPHFPSKIGLTPSSNDQGASDILAEPLFRSSSDSLASLLRHMNMKELQSQFDGVAASVRRYLTQEESIPENEVRMVHSVCAELVAGLGRALVSKADSKRDDDVVMELFELGWRNSNLNTLNEWAMAVRYWITDTDYNNHDHTMSVNENVRDKLWGLVLESQCESKINDILKRLILATSLVIEGLEPASLEKDKLIAFCIKYLEDDNMSSIIREYAGDLLVITTATQSQSDSSLTSLIESKLLDLDKSQNATTASYCVRLIWRAIEAGYQNRTWFELYVNAIPTVLKFIDFDEYEDIYRNEKIRKQSRLFLGLMCQSVMHNEAVRSVIQQVIDYISGENKEKRVKVKLAALSFLKIFVSANRSQLGFEGRCWARRLVIPFLSESDSNVEVRNMAIDVLGGLMRGEDECEGRELATRFIRDMNIGGLVSLASAQPYSRLPKHAVSVIIALASCASGSNSKHWRYRLLRDELQSDMDMDMDRKPTKVEIDYAQKAIAQFRKSHLDEWHEVLSSFDETDRDVINEAAGVGATYFM